MNQPAHQDRPVLIIDFMNMFIRHFKANPSMASTGEPVGGVMGFLGGLGRLCETYNPKKVIVVFESGGSQRKRAISASYKNGRKAPKMNRYYGDDIPTTPENFAMQVLFITRALKCLPVTQVYVSGCEADDVIGYLGRYHFKTSRVILVSSDKDFYQLIDERVQQWSPGQKKLITEQAVIDKFGVSPQNFCSARVFIGDPSDNVSGVKGVGFKNMAKWFPQLGGSEFISHNDVVDSAIELAKTKAAKTIHRIAESRDLALKNWRLIYLDTSQLSGDQIQKVNHQIENEGEGNKMQLMRQLIQSGMQKFDIDRHFAAIMSIRR